MDAGSYAPPRRVHTLPLVVLAVLALVVLIVAAWRRRPRPS
ncbi:MAG TPA: hypothetical protein VFM57_04650 [Thermoleophilaceae bacterium]|nr:hypothetical protein [Thermoleophilaceae bacterium]